MNTNPPPTTAKVERSFARNFHTYHDQATMQAAIAEMLARRLARHVAETGAPPRFAHGVEFGCGTGHLTRALAQRFAFDHLTLNDLVPGAAQVARDHGARFLAGDIRALSWPEGDAAPDLIASASTIQWMEDPAALVARAAEALAPRGWLALTGYGPAQFHELDTLGSQAQAPGLCSAHHLAAALDPTRFDICEARERAHRLWFSSPQHVLRHLRTTGVNAAARAPWTRRKLREFCDLYRARFEKDGRVPLTYHPVWIIARKRA